MWRFSLILVGLMVVSSPTYAGLVQVPIACGSAELSEQVLRDKYKEELVAAGSTNGNALAELWVSRENDTWTLMLRMTDGQLCMFSAGSGWRNLVVEPVGTRL